jgi:hypothetical protein
MRDQRDAGRMREDRGTRVAAAILVLTGLAFAAWWGLAGLQ